MSQATIDFSGSSTMSSMSGLLQSMSVMAFWTAGVTHARSLGHWACPLRPSPWPLG
jgi:hypothetical protein